MTAYDNVHRHGAGHSARGVTAHRASRRASGFWTAQWPLWTLATLLVGAGLIAPAILRPNDAPADARPAHGSAASGGTEPAHGSAAAVGPGPQSAHVRHAAPVADVITAPTFGAADGLPAGWVMTRWGPLGPADRELLIRVRLAGLWEEPAGGLARQRAASQRVKEVGEQLATDHHTLDAQVRQVAEQLQVPLPDQATAEQQGWVRQLTDLQGESFDVAFANILRAAHGKVFGLVASVRAGTRNDMVRTFAQTGVNVVMKHMTLLESIGKVDFTALPEPVMPAPAKNGSAAAPAPIGGGRSLVIWIILAVALTAGVPAAIRVVRLR